MNILKKFAMAAAAITSFAFGNKSQAQKLNINAPELNPIEATYKQETVAFFQAQVGAEDFGPVKGAFIGIQGDYRLIDGRRKSPTDRETPTIGLSARLAYFPYNQGGTSHNINGRWDDTERSFNENGVEKVETTQNVAFATEGRGARKFDTRLTANIPIEKLDKSDFNVQAFLGFSSLSYHQTEAIKVTIGERGNVVKNSEGIRFVQRNDGAFVGNKETKSINNGATQRLSTFSINAGAIISYQDRKSDFGAHISMTMLGRHGIAAGVTKKIGKATLHHQHKYRRNRGYGR